MKLLSIAWLMVGMLFAHSAIAASVTSWGGSQKASLQSQVVGKWQLIATYHNGENISAQSERSDYWIFKRNGWVEHNEESHGLRRSRYWLDGRTLSVKPKNSDEVRSFRIKYIDNKKMIWTQRVEENSYTYNLVRY